MQKNREKLKTLSNIGLVVLIGLLLILGQSILYTTIKQRVSFSSLMFDFSIYFVVFLVITLIPNIKVRKVFLCIAFSLFVGIFMGDVFYANNYGTYFSSRAIAELGNVMGTGGEAFEADMGLRLPLMAIILASILTLGNAIIINYKINHIKEKTTINRFRPMAIFLSLASLVCFNYTFFHNLKTATYASVTDYYTSDTFLYDNLYDPKAYVEKFGYIHFRIRDVFMESEDYDLKSIDKYFNSRAEKEINNQTGAFADYSVINVLSETFDTRVIYYFEELLLNDSDPTNDNYVAQLMPTFYGMYKGTLNSTLDNGSIVFDNYYVPVFPTGCTINSEFMSITGMYPYYGRLWSNNVGNHRYAVDYSYASLPSQLSKAGYNTYYMHSNTSSFYSRDQLVPNLGFDKGFYGNTKGYKDYFIEDWFYDETLMHFFTGTEETGGSELDLTKKFYISMLTYSCHKGNEEKYVDVDNRAENVYNSLFSTTSGSRNEATDSYMLNYITKMIYFDNFLEKLVSWCETNTNGKVLINIYPDHYFYGLSSNGNADVYEDYFGDDENTKEVYHQALVSYVVDGFSSYKQNYLGNGVAAIGANKISHSELISTIDLTPTILNWVQSPSDNFTYKYFFGNDVFDDPDNNFVYYSDLTVQYKGAIININKQIVEKVEGIFNEDTWTSADLDKGFEILCKVYEELEYNRAIINNNYYAWLKLQN